MPIDPDRLPTWSQFLFAAGKQGVQIAERPASVRSLKGREPPVRYLRHGDGLPVIVPTLQLSDIVQEPLLSSLCLLLDVDPSPLGISAEDLL
jgi:hypothetical protein